jgi:hypothetical protein
VWSSQDWVPRPGTRNTNIRSFLRRDRGRPIGGDAARRKSALRGAARFVRRVEELRGRPCGWLARIRDRDDRHKLLRIRMLRAMERGLGRAEPYCDAAIQSRR